MDYHWDVDQGPDCPRDIEVQKHYRSASPRLGPFTVLCSLKVRLTVTDSKGNVSEPDTTTITVTPRKAGFDVTPFVDKVDDQESLPGNLQAFPEEDTTKTEFLAGRAISGCDPRPALNEALCPEPGDAGTWRSGGAYEVGKVADGLRDAPFQGAAYVASTSIRGVVTGITNKALTASGTPPTGAKENVYSYNMAHNHAQYTLFLRLLSKHENMGNGTDARSGHALAFKTALQNGKPEDNVRKTLEALVEPNGTRLQQNAEDAITDAGEDIWKASLDPLQLIGSATIFLWTPPAGEEAGFWHGMVCPIGTSDECANLPSSGSAKPAKGQRGMKIHLDGGIFTPGESVDAGFHSAPVHLATVRADSTGHVSLDVTVPACAAAGSHEFVLTGATSGLRVAIPFSVTGSDLLPAGCGNSVSGLPTVSEVSSTTAIPSDTNRSGTNRSGTHSSGGNSSGGTGDLAATGTPAAELAVAGLILAAAGAGPFVLSRRRLSRCARTSGRRVRSPR